MTAERVVDLHNKRKELSNNRVFEFGELVQNTLTGTIGEVEADYGDYVRVACQRDACIWSRGRWKMSQTKGRTFWIRAHVISIGG